MKNMLSFTFTIVLLISVSYTFGQYPKKIMGDTTRNLSEIEANTIKLNIKHLKTFEGNISIRLWLRGQVVEVIVVNDSITGQIINYIHAKEKPFSRSKSKLWTHNEKYTLTSNEAKKVLELINVAEIQLSLENYLSPMDTLDNKYETFAKIGGWSLNAIEYSDKNRYLILSDYLWSKPLQSSVNEISNLLNLPQKLEKFNKNHPKGSAYSYGGGVAYYKLTRLDIILNTLTIGLYKPWKRAHSKPSANTDNMGKLFVMVFAFAPAFKTAL